MTGKAATPPARGSSTLLDTPEQIAPLAERLGAASIIAFDTEFIRERTFYPQLGLIQVADRSQAWLVDPLKLSSAELKPLLDVLTDSRVLKIAHAVEQDQECLFHGYGIVAEPVLDTSLAAALCGYGDQIGLAALLSKLLRVRLQKTHTRTDWLKRPLPAVMAEYALADVEHLVEAGERLRDDLDRRGRRDWAMELSSVYADPRRYESPPEALAEKLAAGSRLKAADYAVLVELVRWREQTVRQKDRPRRWIAEDRLLVKLAKARPGTAEELTHFRGLNFKPGDARAGELLEAIRRGAATPEDQLRPPPEKDEARADENGALGLLRSFVSILAHQHDVAGRFLVAPDHLLGLLRGRFSTLDDIRRAGLLSEGTVQLIGEQLLGMLNGDVTLSLARGRVQCESRPRGGASQ